MLCFSCCKALRLGSNSKLGQTLHHCRALRHANAQNADSLAGPGGGERGRRRGQAAEAANDRVCLVLLLLLLLSYSWWSSYIYSTPLMSRFLPLV